MCFSISLLHSLHLFPTSTILPAGKLQLRLLLGLMLFLGLHNSVCSELVSFVRSLAFKRMKQDVHPERLSAKEREIFRNTTAVS